MNATVRCSCLLLVLGARAWGAGGDWLVWRELPPMPDPPRLRSFVGIHQGALIVAGGMREEGDSDTLRRDIAVLVEVSGGAYRWLADPRWSLPEERAFGLSVTSERGLVCVGGLGSGGGATAEVLLLRWNAVSANVEIEPRAPLPESRSGSHIVGAAIGNTVYVAAGAPSSNHAWALDLGRAGARWQEVPTWPGPALGSGVAAAQRDGTGTSLYLFGGSGTYAFDPMRTVWRRCSDPMPGGEGAPLEPYETCVASGAHHILLFGRRGSIAAYHTVTDTWAPLGSYPGPSSGSVAVRRGSSYVLAGGCASPDGTPGSRVLIADPPAPAPFGALNYAVLAVYMLSLLVIGWRLAGRERGTEDFFKAGGRVPWWAAGMSIFGTQLSAITFMSIPAKTYATDWRYITLNIAIIAMAPVIIYLFLPFFCRLGVTTAYEYLEKRFNLAARLIGSGMFIALHTGRIAIVLVLPSLALSVVTGFDVSLCIVIMGGVTIAYTVLGGIEAVIWTDVLQVCVFMGGALVSLVMMTCAVDGGLAGALACAEAHHKLRAFDLAFDLTAPTFWVVLLGGLGANLISYGTDQSVIQRYLTTKDERASARGIWINAAFVAPATLIFFSIGTMLFAFYRSHPQALNPALENADAIFPWYIVSQLPPGVAGLLIAALFAAAMSTLDSSMNSIATAVTTDFYRRLKPDADDRACLRLARWLTAIVGLGGTAVALIMAGWGTVSFWDQLCTFIGLFAGGLGGLFLLGIFTRRATGAGGVTGLVVTGVVQCLVRYATDINLLFYTFTGIATCAVVGYLASLVMPAKPKPLDGLTLYTLRRRRAVGERAAGG